ncbi:MAG: tRNA (adenosine(37)-N6)-dimethylallyltransferase MiaA [Cyclobacteriaceae bacterium]
MHVNLIVVTGPTASGKTSFAAHLANSLKGEIISADSRQVYREMNIGTGKDLQDYLVNGRKIPCHLIDIKPPGYKYNVFEFQQDFIAAFEALQKSNIMPILAGGTGMYIESVLQGYKLVSVPINQALRDMLVTKPMEELVAMLQNLHPDLHNSTDTQHKKRTIRAIEIATYYQENKINDKALYFPELRPLILGVKFDREARRQRISERLKARLAEGMIEEVEELLKKVPAEDLIFYGLEYKFVTLYLRNEISYDEMYKGLEVAIHQFAKRQMTWFRKMEREGTQIHWLEGAMPMDEKIVQARMLLEQYNSQNQ